MFKDFRQFIMRGNVIDLAIAVVIGGAFGAIVTALVRDFITPLIAAIYGSHQFSTATFTLHHSKFLYGDFVNAVLSFLIIAAVVFFLVVRPMNKFIEYIHRHDQTPDPTTKKCPECFSEIPTQATRCKFCTTKLAATKS